MKEQPPDCAAGVDFDAQRRLTLGWLGGAVALGASAGSVPLVAAQTSGALRAAAPRHGSWACAIQMRVDAVNVDATREAARLRMRASLERTARQIRGAKSWIGADLGLVVLPEYFLTGFPTTETIPQWIDKAVLDMDGEEYAALGLIAQDNAVYLAGNAYERDPKFPGLFFQCSFLVAPRGDVVLRYRRLVSNLVPTPYDVWDRYLDVYGLDGVFPVARTPLGHFAAIASEEILYPEIARCHAMRGAEIFLHSSSEAYTTTLAPKKIARMARALENLAWVVSCNSAGVANIDIALGSADGGSEVVDHMGSVVVAAGQGETMTAHARIDLDELREYRRRTGIANMYVRQPFELYAGSYAAADFRRPNGLLDGSRIVVPERRWFRERQQETLQRLEQRGLIPQEDRR
jgi:predicted amidohydrolase